MLKQLQSVPGIFWFELRSYLQRAFSNQKVSALKVQNAGGFYWRQITIKSVGAGAGSSQFASVAIFGPLKPGPGCFSWVPSWNQISFVFTSVTVLLGGMQLCAAENSQEMDEPDPGASRGSSQGAHTS